MTLSYLHLHQYQTWMLRECTAIFQFRTTRTRVTTLDISRTRTLRLCSLPLLSLPLLVELSALMRLAFKWRSVLFESAVMEIERCYCLLRKFSVGILNKFGEIVFVFLPSCVVCRVIVEMEENWEIERLLFFLIIWGLLLLIKLKLKYDNIFEIILFFVNFSIFFQFRETENIECADSGPLSMHI